MPFFLFILGYSTITAYFCSGVKAAEFLSPKYGRILYFVYAVGALFVFSFLDNYQAMLIMSIAGASLLILNVVGIFILREEINFNFAEAPPEEDVIPVSQTM